MNDNIPAGFNGEGGFELDEPIKDQENSDNLFGLEELPEDISTGQPAKVSLNELIEDSGPLDNLSL